MVAGSTAFYFSEKHNLSSERFQIERELEEIRVLTALLIERHVNTTPAFRDSVAAGHILQDLRGFLFLLPDASDTVSAREIDQYYNAMVDGQDGAAAMNRDLRVRVARLGVDAERLTYLGAELTAFRWAMIACWIIGAGISITGFRLWYTRVQVFLDSKMRSEGDSASS